MPRLSPISGAVIGQPGTVQKALRPRSFLSFFNSFWVVIIVGNMGTLLARVACALSMSSSAFYPRARLAERRSWSR